MTKIIHVAAGVVVNSDGHILIARRPAASHQGGLWEFPGGKLEDGESVQQALVRELDEEIGITSTCLEPLIQIRHDYPDKSVLLDVWRVTQFEGDAHGKEGQPVKWVSPEALNDFNFPAANVPIVTAAQLPPVYLVSADEVSIEACVAKVQSALDRGIRLLQLRQTQWSSDQWKAAVPDILDRCRQVGARLILNSPKGDVCADGLHLTSAQLMASDQPVARAALRWVSAACHSREQLLRAQQRGVDFVCLSPVELTKTHPNASPLGWDQFSSWVSDAKIPVFALGGMSDQTLPVACKSGAQGVAGISAWWPN
ncbi:MAG: Nudix family hydrolase [Cellvibrionaceae bacterium]